MTNEDELNIWAQLRIGWDEAHKKERAQRADWDKLDDWIKMEDQAPKKDQRVLLRDPKDVPYIGWFDDFGWWALFDGDLWPMRNAPKMWREFP